MPTGRADGSFGTCVSGCLRQARRLAGLATLLRELLGVETLACAGERVAFRRVDRSLLPRIEQYLRNFPGVTRIRRDDSAGNGVRYRLSHDGAARGTELSLRKMLHHLPLEARIVRTGNSYIVEAEKAAEPAAGSPNW